MKKNSSSYSHRMRIMSRTERANKDSDRKGEEIKAYPSEKDKLRCGNDEHAARHPSQLRRKRKCSPLSLAHIRYFLDHLVAIDMPNEVEA